MKMLRFLMGEMRMDRSGNEYIIGTAQVTRFGSKAREARWRWFGHVQRRDAVGRRMLKKELPVKRERGRTKEVYGTRNLKVHIIVAPTVVAVGSSS